MAGITMSRPLFRQNAGTKVKQSLRGEQALQMGRQRERGRASGEAVEETSEQSAV